MYTVAQKLRDLRTPSQPGTTVMDPFHSYASRFVIWDGGSDDTHPGGSNNPNLRTLVVEVPNSEKHLEFDVRLDAIAAVSPYIKTIFSIYPTKRRLGISATADHMQIFIKYLYTHVYDPTDISRRHRNKHDIVFRQIDFYFFCKKMGYEALCTVVRTGIQASLDLMTWSPVPGAKDRVLLYPNDGSSKGPSHVLLLPSLLFACKVYYPKLTQGNPIKRSLLIYHYHLWPVFPTGFIVEETMTHQMGAELWGDMKTYKRIAQADIYTREAPKYSVRTDFILGRFLKISLACLACYLVYKSG